MLAIPTSRRGVTRLSVIFEDNHLLVVDKVAGLATQGGEERVPTVARQAAQYLKAKYDKPGKAFVGVVSRLDRLVSGVLVLARTSKAASRLSEQIRSRTIDKRYLAWVEGRLPALTEDWTQVDHWVFKDEHRQRMQIAAVERPGAQRASMRYRSLAHSHRGSLLEVDLVTGRKHQIRVQLAELGHPIVGDSKYGSGIPKGSTRRGQWVQSIGLHSHRLGLKHPTRPDHLVFHSSPLPHWPTLPNDWRTTIEQLQNSTSDQE